MKTKNINLKWFLILPLIFVTINSCKKDREEEEVVVVTPPPADDYKVTVFNNQTGNPSADALQAQIVNTQQNYQVNFYGTFLGDNSPDQANTVTYHKDGNDTIVYLLLDPTSHKLQTAYIEVSGLKQPWVIKHEYITGNDNAITVSIYDYNWITNTGVLKYQATHETNNGVHTETPLYAKTNHLYGIGAIGAGFVVAEAVFYGTGVGFLGTAAGAALVGAVGTIVAVGLTVAVVVGAIAVITSGNANAAALESGDYPLPPNTPVNNPAPPTNNPNNPTPNLPPTPCAGVVITFNACMDQFGSILISNPTGGSGFHYSLANSAFQQSQVFNGPYTAGSYLIMVKNGDGCTKAEVRNITPQSCSTTVTDIDGNVYQTVNIGTQCWMAENLKVTKYRNGVSIANTTVNSTWVSLTTGAYCNYNNDINSGLTYGRLYNWHAVNDSRNIAPLGWHIPTDAEWCQLENAVETGTDVVCSTNGWRGTNTGSKMKSSSSNTPAWDGTNSFGFAALPAGYRSYQNGAFYDLGSVAFYWSATESANTHAWSRSLMTGFMQSSRGSSDKEYGMSVRCIKD